MNNQVSSPLLRRINERRVLEMIQHLGPVSRAVVGRASGMTAPTVSKAVGSLIKSGLLEENLPIETTVGRPGKVLQLASRTANVLGIVIDAKMGWVISAGLDGKITPERIRSFATPSDYATLLELIVEHARELTQEFGVEPRGAGVSVPGSVNSTRQEVVFSPNLRLLDSRQPGVDLSERLGVPCVMLQESHALCLSEQMYGESRGVENFAMLDISTGLGLGVMIGGELLAGQSGLAGELGHITVDPQGLRCGCGNLGCLETLATDSALARQVSSKVGRELNIEEVVELVRKNEIDASEDLAHSSEYLAIAIAAVINIFNPVTLFVHGKMFEATDDMFQHVLEQVQKRALKPSFSDCTVRQARGSKRQGVIAGIVHHLTTSRAPTLS